MLIRGGNLYNGRNKYNKHNKRIIVVTVVLILFSIVTLITSRSVTPIESIFKDTVANIEYYVIKTPLEYIGNIFSEFKELKNVYEENAQLKEQLDKYAKEVARNEVLSSELEELKDLTKIKYLPTDYTVSYTKVISRDVESWNNEVTIDLGKSAGVKEGMAVIGVKGMIGTITNVTELSSTVSLLSNESSKSQLPIMIMSDGKSYYGLLNKYDVEKKCYRITLLSDVEKISKDAKVVTSGLGGAGKSPKGILIGTVSKFTTKGEDGQMECLVKPSADFNSLNYVAVVKRVNSK